MSRDRVLYLADLILKEMSSVPGLTVKAPEDIRLEIIRVLSDETKFEESIEGEVRKILSSYSRPLPEGSREWDVMYQKTREEVLRRRFRTT